MPHPKVKISDNSGNEVAVTSNALDVNIAGGASIDIGDVDMFLDGGTAVVGNTGAVTAGTLRVTIATDDPHWGSVGAAADADGVAHGQLRHIANSMSSVASQATLANIQSVNTYISGAFKAEDAAHSSGDVGTHVLAVRNDTLASLSGDDGDYSSLQVNADGALYVTGGGGGTEYTEDVATANPIVGTATLIERDDALSSVTPAEGDWIGLRGTAEGALWTQDFNSDTITTHLSEIEGAVETIEGAVSGSEMQVDIVAALPAGSNTIGVVDLGSTDNAVLDAMVVDLAAMEALLITIDSDTDAIKTAVQILDNAIDGSEMQVDIVSGTVDLGSTDNAVLDSIVTNTTDMPNVIGEDGSTGPSKCISIGGTDASGNTQEIWVNTDGRLQVQLAAGTNAIGKLTANSGVDIGDVDVTSISAGTNAIGKVGHDITGMVSDVDADVGLSAEKIHTAADVAIKRIDIQAHPDNTGYIFVGDSGVAGNGSGGGIRLAAGDFYSLDIDNTGDVYVAASVADEDVSYIYYT